MMKPVVSIRLNLCLPLLVTGIFILFAVTVAAYEHRLFIRDIYQTANQFIRQDLANLQHQLVKEIASGDELGARQALTARGVNKNYQLLLATNQQGTILYATQFELEGQKIQDSQGFFAPEIMQKTQQSNMASLQSIDDTDLITAYFPLPLVPQSTELRTTQSGVIFLIYNVKPELDKIWLQIFKTKLPIIFGMLLMLFSLLWLFKRFVAEPVEHIAQIAEAFSKDHQLVHCDVQGKGELVKLAKIFNQMIGEIQERLEKQQKVGEQLIKSQLQLKTILDYSPSLISTKDLQGNVTLVNQRFDDLEGVSREEYIGKNIFDLFSHDIAKALWENDLKAQKGPIEIEEKAPHKDGSIHHYLTQKFPMFNSDNELIGTGAISMDITEKKKAEDESLRNRILLDSIIQAIPDLFFLVDQNFTISDYRAGNLNDLYVSPEKFINRKMTEVLPEPVSNLFVSHLNVVNETGVMTSFEYTLAVPDGNKQFEARINKLLENSKFIIIVRDITQRKEAERALIESEQKFRSVFQSSSVGLIIARSEKGIISGWNQGAEKIFGYSENQVLGKELGFLMPTRFRQAHQQGIQRAAQHQVISKEGKLFEVIGLHQSGEEFDMEFTLSCWKQAEEIFFSALIIDISERKRAEKKILHQAHFDALTNVPNRFLALDRLNQLISDAKRHKKMVAVVFLDLDDFKKVNDTLGHETGDQLLVAVAQRLQNSVRSGDTIGRLGGDEFIVLLPGLTHINHAKPVVETIADQFRSAFNINDHDLLLTCSLGVAIYPDDGETPSELLRNADSAMYYSKEQGRNAFSYFTPQMSQKVLRSFALEEQLHGALERNEFEVYFQPQIDIRNKKILGAEALLRWKNKLLGNVSPGEFIPIAEQSGVILPLGQFVLKQALKVCKQWQQKHQREYRMAVNISPRQFREPDLIHSIVSAIENAELPTSNLELEITEGVLMNDRSHIGQVLGQLSDLGICIAMDDFGTGYSSLSYLRVYPFNVLKIDRNFISELSHRESDRELVSATISMARALGIKVIAEGVETQEQYQILASLECDIAQGYLFSKPISATQLLEFSLETKH